MIVKHNMLLAQYCSCRAQIGCKQINETRFRRPWQCCLTALMMADRTASILIVTLSTQLVVYKRKWAFRPIWQRFTTSSDEVETVLPLMADDLHNQNHSHIKIRHIKCFEIEWLIVV